jgi:hypothetical protein
MPARGARFTRVPWITLAAEQSRRIVPLVLEKAEMTGNIRFELAGVQQLSFTGRPFDAAMAELRAELRALSAQAPTTGRSPTDSGGVGSRWSGWSSRRFVLIGVILVAVAGGSIVATCITSGSASSSLHRPAAATGSS